MQEHDAGCIQALALRALQAGWTVLLAGDFSTREHPPPPGGPGVFGVLGSFWAGKPVLQADRLAEARLFALPWRDLRLVPPPRGFVPAGMRSGGLDADGCSGQAALHWVGPTENDQRTSTKIIEPMQRSFADATTFRRLVLRRDPGRRQGGGCVGAAFDPADGPAAVDSATALMLTGG